MDSSTPDQTVQQEGNALDDSKTSFVERDGKVANPIHSTEPLAHQAEHWAFWCFYCDYFGKHVGTEDAERNSYAQRSIEECLRIWKSMTAQARAPWVNDAVEQATAAKSGALINLQRSDYQPQLPQLPGVATARMEKERTSFPSSSRQEINTPQIDGLSVEPDFHADDDGSPNSQDVVPVHLDMSVLFDSRTTAQLEKCVERGIELLGNIQQTLRGLPIQEASQWLQAIENVQKQDVRPTTVVGVVGATGAGKSSVINAILDEERLVPTNCMRACTAVVMEISYNYHDGAPYRAEVEFISRPDWHKMLKILFQDLFDQSGQLSREYHNEDSESGVAYAQIKAVYPRMTKEEAEKTTLEDLMEHENVACLGTTRNIDSDDPLAFYKKLQRFVDSKEKASGKRDKAARKEKKPPEMEFWPLIRVVRIYVKAPVLATGAVIVDLPGVHDDNQARAAVAQGYMKQCTGLWIVAPITRAVDDKSAKTLLGDAFKRQLKMDGGFNSVTFICSKTDDISITEAQDSLGLDEELSQLWDKSEVLRNKKTELTKQIEDQKETKSEMDAALAAVEEELKVWESLQEQAHECKTVFRPKAKSRKRQRADKANAPKKRKYVETDSDRDDTIDEGDSHSDGESAYNPSDTSEDQGAPLTENEITMKMAELRGAAEKGRRDNVVVDLQLKELYSRLDDIERRSEKFDIELSSKCIVGRNEYSRDAIRQDYAAGIRELDQEIAENEDAPNFDPEVDQRDYDEISGNLPVFCVSSRAYQKMKGRLQKEKTPQGFTHIDETEVPALQAHCFQLTTAGREAACRKFLTSMSQLINSLRLWVSNDGAGRNLTEGQLKEEAQILNEALAKLDDALEQAVTAIMDEIAHELQGKIYDAYPAATAAARSEANNTVRKWGSPRNRDNSAAGGLSWPTYKAVVRRDGVFTNARGSNNFNEQLIGPVMRHLAGPWELVFARRIPGILNGYLMNIGKILTTFHEEVEVRNGRSHASFPMLKQQMLVYHQSMKDAMHEARNQIMEKQRNISREFEPRILKHMLSIYHTCAADAGPGQYDRMKKSMSRYVDEEKLSMFDNAVEHVRQLATTMLVEIKNTLLGKVDAIFMAIKSDYTGVVMGQGEDGKPKLLPRDQRLILKKVLQIIGTAESVLGRAVPEYEADSEAKLETERTTGAV